ncbi:hypothetical protein [Citrobacter sp. Cpa228]|uniref:gp53-like domain-containing protein n=1 Tax=Citrobacter TaxID=544 RepID=UPI0002673ED9|nr:hypothetical protein [Citrobacter sp. Cpa228]EIQ80396.1 hypothetical protein SF123566_8130 [Shigella flexneri 1235-66]MDM2925660.1 hypothetical protein [Citrobacter sp. Cpa228]
MHRIDTPTAQKDKFGAGKNGFTRGNPQTGTPATDLDDDYCDSIQEELAGIVEASGVALDKSKRNQVLTAVKALLLSRAHPFADIKADGAVAEALSNLGLRESVSESGSFQLGDFQVVWGRGSTGSNGTGSVQFPRAFVGIPYLVAPSDISSGPEGVNAVGWDLSNSTAAGARILSADSKSSGIATTFSYIAIGKGVV